MWRISTRTPPACVATLFLNAECVWEYIQLYVLAWQSRNTGLRAENTNIALRFV